MTCLVSLDPIEWLRPSILRSLLASLLRSLLASLLRSHLAILIDSLLDIRSSLLIEHVAIRCSVRNAFTNLHEPVRNRSWRSWRCCMFHSLPFQPSLPLNGLTLLLLLHKSVKMRPNPARQCIMRAACLREKNRRLIKHPVRTFALLWHHHLTDTFQKILMSFLKMSHLSLAQWNLCRQARHLLIERRRQVVDLCHLGISCRFQSPSPYNTFARLLTNCTHIAQRAPALAF